LFEVIVSPRSSSTDKQRRGPFRARSRQTVAPPASAPSLEYVSEVKVTRLTGRTRSRRDLQPEIDRTTYSCQCGFVFQAAVLTSVACPHCGDSQAW
jgi:hypothetical protein